MADIDFPDNDAQTATIEVRLGDRTFSPMRTPATRREAEVRNLRQRKEQNDLPAVLHGIIVSKLVWNSLPAENQQRQSLVESYIESLKQIDRFREDVQAMIRLACHANLEFRQGTGPTHEQAANAAISSKLDEMMSDAAADWLPTRNVLDAKLVSQPVSVIQQQLQAALSEAVSVFVKQFFELLAKLVNKSMIGLIEWMPNHCCNYHFFKEVVIQENEGPSRTVRELSEDEEPGEAWDPDTGRRPIGWEKVEETRGKGRHIYRIARHEHSVMNAIQTSIRNSRVTIPPEVVPLVERMPEWLYPVVQIIDGDIIRERIIEEDQKAENWADVVVRDVPIFGGEPAVIIGPYVLTGWGPREVGAEQAKRQANYESGMMQRTAEVAQRRAPWFAASVAVLTLIALFFFMRMLHGNGGIAFVVLATLAIAGATWQAAYDYATARRSPTAALSAHCWTASIILQVLLVFWFVARWTSPLSWLTPVVLFVGLGVVHSLEKRFH